MKPQYIGFMKWINKTGYVKFKKNILLTIHVSYSPLKKGGNVFQYIWYLFIKNVVRQIWKKISAVLKNIYTWLNVNDTDDNTYKCRINFDQRGSLKCWANNSFQPEICHKNSSLLCFSWQTRSFFLI